MDRASVDQAMEWIAEYDAAAEWCARRGLSGKVGDDLPTNLSARVLDEINDDVGAFQVRVSEMAYGIARSRRGEPES